VIPARRLEALLNTVEIDATPTAALLSVVATAQACRAATDRSGRERIDRFIGRANAVLKRRSSGLHPPCLRDGAAC